LASPFCHDKLCAITSRSSSFQYEGIITVTRIEIILDTLASMYPDAKCALTHTTAFELLVATMLSAQCTDKRVNMVTERLFKNYCGPADFAALVPAQLEPLIHELGLYHTKARNIIAAAQVIVSEQNGEVPRDRKSLEALPGVGRKTANVVLSNAFGEPAIAVDTHVFRVARRLDLATGRTPEQTERILNDVIPRDLWSQTHHRLIYHGRQLCTARRPACDRCPLLPHCPAGQAQD
jgi:endonuclease-3